MLVAASGLAISAYGAGPLNHARAATLCDDGAGNEFKEVSIAGGPNSAIPGMPFTLAVEIGDAGSPLDPHVGICYSTNTEAQDALGQPAVANGAVMVDAVNPASNDGFSTGAAVLWAPTSDVRATVIAATTPTVVPSAGPPGTTGDTLTVTIPFFVCAGPCVVNAVAVNPTGLIVGQLVPQSGPPGSVGAAYTLSSLSIYVNGVETGTSSVNVGGAFVDPAQVSENLFGSSSGPCVLNLCAPVDGYVETTGNPALVLYIPGTSIVEPVGVPKTCLYNEQDTCP